MPLVGDDLPAVSILERVKVRSRLHLPRAALPFCPDDPVLLQDAGLKSGPTRSRKNNRLATCDYQDVLRCDAIVAASGDLRVCHAGQGELDRSQEVLDRLSRGAAGHLGGSC